MFSNGKLTLIAHRLSRRPIAWVLLALAASLLLGHPAMAQDLSPINTFFTTLGTALTGATGRALGCVCI